MRQHEAVRVALRRFGRPWTELPADRGDLAVLNPVLAADAAAEPEFA